MANHGLDRRDVGAKKYDKKCNTHTHIYIYIYRERERENVLKFLVFVLFFWGDMVDLIYRGFLLRGYRAAS